MNIAPAMRLLTPDKRAEVIYKDAQSAMLQKLWKAALGSADAEPGTTPPSRPPLSSALDLFRSEDEDVAEPLSPRAATAPLAEGRQSLPVTEAGGPLDLGINARHGSIIEDAARRTGLPPAALAAIVDAEAAKNADGQWLASSKNPRSTATGLTQFLAGSWQSEAERPGTFLHSVARGNGWLDDKGGVRGERRQQLLSLRLDARCSIEAAADYAKANLTRLTAAGVEIGENMERIAQLAYLGHHLGPGDVVDYLKGDIAPARARMLLAAQIGAKAASERIAQVGDAVQAHRQWLTAYIARRVVPDRFTRES